MTGAFLVVACALLLYWALYARFYVGTNDAYVHGNQVMLTPQIPGIVVKIYAEDTTLVEEGQVLIELDPTDQKLIFEKSVNALAQTVRDVSQMFASVYQLAADLDAAKAEAVKAEIYFTDRDALKATGAISVEDYITAELNFFAAKANMASLEFALMKAITAVQGTTVSTHPLVKGAADEVKTQWVALERCKIRAPQTGIIAERMVQVGESVAPDTPLLAVVPLEQMWVEANYKEVQLEGVRLGQPVVMRSDLYGGDCLYRGEVVGIAAGTGAAFSLLPPQNATGNWIKIVQRVPVRVKLNPEQLKAYPLRIGLSMEAKVDIHNQQASRVPLVPCQGPLYETRVFQSQEKGAEALVAQIIEENMFFEE